MRNLTETAPRPLLLGALLWALTATASAADALRCGAKLVSTEALAAEVIGACGQPDYVDRWGYQSPVATLAAMEKWYYNFGPAQLLRILRFQHGRLIAIDSDGHGFGRGGGRSCGPSTNLEGFSKYRLEATCGDPVTRRAEFAPRSPDSPYDDFLGRYGSTALVYAEEWVYNFGSANFLRVVRLENGRVTDVRSEGRGYGAPR